MKTFFPFLLFFFILSTLVWAPPRKDGSFRPKIYEVSSPSVPDFAALSLYQKGFTTPEKKQSVDVFKEKLLRGEFDFSINDQVSGLFNPSTNTFYVSEGHTRIAAALEIAHEKNDWSYFKKLIQSGYWDETDTVPKETYPLFMRTNIFNFLGCRKTIAKISP